MTKVSLRKKSYPLPSLTIACLTLLLPAIFLSFHVIIHSRNTDLGPSPGVTQDEDPFGNTAVSRTSLSTDETSLSSSILLGPETNVSDPTDASRGVRALPEAFPQKTEPVTDTEKDETGVSSGSNKNAGQGVAKIRGTPPPKEGEKRDPLEGWLSPEDNEALRQVSRELVLEIARAQEEAAARLEPDNPLEGPGLDGELEGPDTLTASEAEIASVLDDPRERRAMLQRRIDAQLAPYKKWGPLTYADVAALKKRTEMSVHFIIKPGNVTLIKDHDGISDNWSYWFRSYQVQQLFEVLSAQKRIPDLVEIVVNLHAAPRLKRSEKSPARAPILSYCSTPGHYDLIGVGYQYHRCLMKEQYNDTELCKLAWNADEVRKEHSWGNRKGTALWRGSPTGGLYRIEDWKERTRSKLAFLSKAHPDILDAKFTSCSEGQCTEEAEDAIGKELGYADRLSNFTDYVQYKYLVDIDGESWSSRFFNLLASGATIFKQSTKYREFSDFFFAAGTHYVRYKSDLGDLVSLLQGAEGRQEELRRMADRSLALVERLVEDDVILEYMGMLLTSYAELFVADGETVT